jgi:diketogulonate reductase-like aldo/keto reductase
MSPVEDPIVEMVAEKMSERIKEKITPAQVILRWALQKGFAVIPRSTNKENMKANIKVLSMPEIDREEMAMIDTLQELVANPTSLAVPV